MTRAVVERDIVEMTKVLRQPQFEPSLEPVDGGVEALFDLVLEN